MAKELKREGLSEEKKGLILALLAEGHSERRVASILNISKTAVHKNKIKQQTLGTTKPQTGRGRKRLSVDQDDRQLIRMSLNNRRMTSSDLQKEWEMTAGIKCTARTVRNRLLGAGLKSCKARKKPFINEKERARPSMGDVPVNAISLDLLRDARETVRTSPLGVINTPMIPWCQTTLPLNIPCNIHIKLENMQRTGSFKIRGVANQFARRPKGGNFVTMSAGNYGKSFAYATKHYGSKGKVVMPETAPESRSTLIQSFGCEVERVPTSCLINVVNRCVEENDMTFLHSYDDLDLIAGHARYTTERHNKLYSSRFEKNVNECISVCLPVLLYLKSCVSSLGFEILELMPQPDVVVVCCGGGGLLAGVAAAIKLSGCVKTRIYGVEPEGACTMYKSLIEKKPVGMDSESIASGLAPPTAGTLPYELCQSYVEEIVLVSDEEIKSAVSTLYRAGLLVEPSGCAAFAAIANNRIPDIAGRNVVVILSGGNIGKDELTNFAD